MHSSLDTPDLPEWRALPGYSPRVAARLVQAYDWLANGDNLVSDYLWASNEAAPSRARRMALPQRLRVFYLDARAYAANGQYAVALERVEDGLTVALEVGDQSAVGTLLYLRGALNAGLLHYAEGASDYEESREWLREHHAIVGSSDVPTELHLTIQQANLRFFMAQYEMAECLIEEARGLVPYCPGQQKERATIAWVEANLFRWRGVPERALRPALAAAEIYTVDGPANSAARIQTVAAEVALDIATSLPCGSDREAMLQLARPHIGEALRLAGEAGDEAGKALASLAEMRAQRLDRCAEDHLTTLGQFVRTARHNNDSALLGQVLTAIGDELAARGEPDGAQDCYRQALVILDGSDLRALRAWPWRALHRQDG